MLNQETQYEWSEYNLNLNSIEDFALDEMTRDLKEFNLEEFKIKEKIYLEGTHAFLYNTHSLNQNPHSDAVGKVEWHNGWLDAKTSDENPMRHFYIEDETETVH